MNKDKADTIPFTPGVDTESLNSGQAGVQIEEMTNEGVLEILFKQILRLNDTKYEAVNQWMDYHGHSSIDDL